MKRIIKNKLYIEPVYDGRGKVVQNVSTYQPTDAEKDRIMQLRRDYEAAEMIRNNPFEEFNNRDLEQYIDDNQRAFNSFVPQGSDHPEDSWRANTVNGMTRNKCISIAAHVTSNILYPSTVAQNKDDEEDQEAAMVMRDLMEFSWNDSDYERSFVYSIISALFNPCVLIEDGYYEVIRQFKEIQPDGSWQYKEKLDEVYSGFKNFLIKPEEMFIGNAYEHNIQKQPFLIKRRILDYSDAQVMYGDLEPFNLHVMPGLRYFYSNEDDMFYEQRDEQLSDRQVEEVIYYNRYADLELRIINGVLMDDPDRPMQRTDKYYPFAKSGYEIFDDGSFFYHKPLTDKLALEQDVLDTAYNMMIDAAFLQTMPPAIIYGDEEITSMVNVPGKVTPLSDPQARFETIQTGNMNNAQSLVQELKGNAAESSSDPMQSGMAAQGTSTAFEIAQVQQNAMRVLGLFGKMVKFMVEDFGKLRLNTCLEQLTVAEAIETMNGSTALRFHNILVPKSQVDSKTRKVEFTDDMPETEEELASRGFSLMKKEMDKDMVIMQVNPSLFRELKFKVKVEADLLFSSSEAVRKALNLEAYDRAIQNPILNPETVTREYLLSNYSKGEEDKFLKKEEQPQPPAGGEGSGLSGSIVANAAQPTKQVPA